MIPLEPDDGTAFEAIDGGFDESPRTASSIFKPTSDVVSSIGRPFTQRALNELKDPKLKAANPPLECAE